MAALVGALNWPPGLLALAFSTSLGLFVAARKVKRTTCMSSLIVPALFFYVFILI
jgi:TctA family transporter